MSRSLFCPRRIALPASSEIKGGARKTLSKADGSVREDGADDYWRDMERYADLFGLLSEKWPSECLQIFHHTDSGVIFWAAIAYGKHPTRLAIEPLEKCLERGHTFNERMLREALSACERG